MKKITSLLLSILIVLTLVSIQTSAINSVYEWDGNIEEPTKLITIDDVYYYEISTAKELAYIAQTGGNWLGYNYILANDIVLNNVELTYDLNGNLTQDPTTLNQWVPIHNFKGIFNGNGFSVYGVYIDTDKQAGFFTSDPFSGKSASIIGIHIKNSYIKGRYTVGGIISLLNGSIFDCSYDGVVIGEGITQDTTGVGGIIGHSYSNITNCTNYGDIYGDSDVGGVLGAGCDKYIANCENYGCVFSNGEMAGGIAGSYYWGSLNNCHNYGNVIGNNDVGGIVGSSSGNICSCLNTGDISGILHVGGVVGNSYSNFCNNLQNSGRVYGKEYVGGIVGYQFGESNDYSLLGNTGIVVGSSYVGGIVSCFNNGSLSKAYNIANVSGTSNVGAIAGYSDSVWGRGTVNNCYYKKDNTTSTTINGFGNAPDVDGITNVKDAGFFCVNADNTLNFDGHNYDSIITQPSNGQSGYIIYICQKCDHTYKVEIAHIPGDINGDGTVNNKDLTRLFQYLSDWEVEVNSKALDINGDGQTNNKDLTRLFQYLSDWDVEIF